MQRPGGEKVKVKGFALWQYFAKYEDIRLALRQPFPSHFRGCFLSRNTSASNFQNTATRNSVDRLLALERAHYGISLRSTGVIPGKL
jgi:hypothetical protein